MLRQLFLIVSIFCGMNAMACLPDTGIYLSPVDDQGNDIAYNEIYESRQIAWKLHAAPGHAFPTPDSQGVPVFANRCPNEGGVVWVINPNLPTTVQHVAGYPDTDMRVIPLHGGTDGKLNTLYPPLEVLTTTYAVSQVHGGSWFEPASGFYRSIVWVGYEGTAFGQVFNIYPQIRADLNYDGIVNELDLFVLLASWGHSPDHISDLNVDGAVNIYDLLAVIQSWGLLN